MRSVSNIPLTHDCYHFFLGSQNIHILTANWRPSPSSLTLPRRISKKRVNAANRLGANFKRGILQWYRKVKDGVKSFKKGKEVGHS